MKEPDAIFGNANGNVLVADDVMVQTRLAGALRWSGCALLVWAIFMLEPWARHLQMPRVLQVPG